MGRRRAPSLESLSRVIADIHDAGVDAAGWPAALRRLGDLFDAPRATIWVQDQTGGSRALYTLGPDDRITSDYMEHYWRHDHMRPAILRAPAGTVLTGGMVMSRAEFVRTEFYAGFAELVAGLPDDILAHLAIATVRQLRRRLARSRGRNGKGRTSPLERSAQQLIAELGGQGENGDDW